MCAFFRRVQHVPCFEPRFRHDERQAHCSETLLNQAARYTRIIGRENLGATRNIDAADASLSNIRLASRKHVAQNLLDVEQLSQTRAVYVSIETCDAGHGLSARMGLRRQHLIPLKADDVIDLFNRKPLGRPGKLSDEQDPWFPPRCTTRQPRQVNDRNDLPANISNAEDVVRRACDDRKGRHLDDLPNLEHVDAVKFALRRVRCFAKAEQEQFEAVVSGQVGPLLNIMLGTTHLIRLDSVQHDRLFGARFDIVDDAAFFSGCKQAANRLRKVRIRKPTMRSVSKRWSNFEFYCSDVCRLAIASYVLTTHSSPA